MQVPVPYVAINLGLELGFITTVYFNLFYPICFDVGIFLFTQHVGVVQCIS